MFLNKKINFDYFIIKEYIAGISLLGSEVTSLKMGKCNLIGSFCLFVGDELFMRNVHLGVNDKIMFPHNPIRDRKLLLSKSELQKIKEELKVEKGRTIVISKIYRNKKGLFKVNICLVKGKKNYDKREALKEKESNRILKNL